MADAIKERTLERVGVILNPDHDAWSMSDKYPHKQLPHIMTSYRACFGEKLGLCGVQAAACDPQLTRLTDGGAAEIHQLFCDVFDLNEFIVECMTEVNKQSDSDGSRISRDELSKWAGGEGAASGFDPRSIYFDEEARDEYIGEPAEGEEYEPFLRGDLQWSKCWDLNDLGSLVPRPLPPYC